ncbi:hypothetical protein [Dysgonomonas sp. 511]|uniref:hypothetical protein n=1 Tax=Dysgonomonas sp. 511 TaxID=2302930 RepID=UPI0013D3CEC1|nr:hypothetical protein [Dysgonomonas sp. 511]NDV77880.1 hypothetical protein [Dysgonomonas sp. 511]
MKTFAVKREINGKLFLKDEDRITADTWDEAIAKLIRGTLSGRYDDSCVLDGIIVYEEEISNDDMLDIMINNNLTEKV